MGMQYRAPAKSVSKAKISEPVLIRAAFYTRRLTIHARGRDGGRMLGAPITAEKAS
jgi:hypothetical protein